MIPERFKNSLKRYAENKCPTGSFLQAVLENDLIQAVALADSEAKRCIPEIVFYCYHELPAESWGSGEKVKNWLKGF